jgi:hypothetical protein
MREAMRVSIMDRILDFFTMPVALHSTFLDSRLRAIKRLAQSPRLGGRWFSIREQDEFTNRQLAARALDEFLARRPVAR